MRSLSRRSLALKLSLLTLAMTGCMASSDNPEVIFERGNLLFERGQFVEAVPLYTEAAKTLSEFPDVFFRRGLCYENLNLDDKALEDYTRCLELDPEHTDAINNKGVILARVGRFEEAATVFTNLIQQQPDSVLAIRNRGLCYHDLQQFDKAIKDYDLAITMAPEDANNWFQRGNVYLEQGMLPEAIADYDKAIDSDPEYAKAWMNRGVARFGMDERQDAVKDFERAQELDNNIILPGIDWASADAAVELAPVTEVAAAKPVLQQVLASWNSTLNFALSHLKENGYSEITVTEDLPEHRCARLQASRESHPVEILVGSTTTEEIDQVLLPVINDEKGVSVIRTLLIVRDTPNKESGEVEHAVAKFDETWTSQKQGVKPLIMQLQPSE